jgi:glycosyltransferase involved in cell wall biosynthesis
MSHGKPIVAANTGGIAEIIQDGHNGLLVPPEDPAALAAAIGRLATGPGLRSQLGAAALHDFETGGWTEDAVVGHTLEIYSEARQIVRPSFDAAPARAQAGAAVANWTPVYMVVYGFGPLGEGEQYIASLAAALQWAGCQVTVITQAFTHSDNRYVRQLRRAGVRINANDFSLMAFHAHGGYAGIKGAVRSQKPAVIHLHYWSAAPPWSSRPLIREFAQANGIPYAETNHSGPPPPPPLLPADPHARLAFESGGSRQLHLVTQAAELYERSARALR